VKLQGGDYKVKFDHAFKVAPTLVVLPVYTRGASYPETITKITKEQSVVTTEVSFQVKITSAEDRRECEIFWQL
jgi:hypothetical protein